MRYVCLVYLDEQKVFSRSASDAETLIKDSEAYDQELKASGHLVVANALQPVSSAMTIRVRNGRMSSTDGPFMETKEVLGGFILIEARDLNEATKIASKIPLAKLGTIEVRPVMGADDGGGPHDVLEADLCMVCYERSSLRPRSSCSTR